MLYDALFVLWGSAPSKEQVKAEPFQNVFANEGDAEMYSRICDIANSYKKIETFVDQFRKNLLSSPYEWSKQKKSQYPYSLYTKALAEAFAEVLLGYKEQILLLEKMVKNNPSYTLTFVYSYVERFQRLFNALYRIILTTKQRNLKGCQVLSLVHQSLLTGDEMVHKNLLIIFGHINNLFTNQLCSWLLYGELLDTRNEFLICPVEEIATVKSVRSPSTMDISISTTLKNDSLECGYRLNPIMIPSFIPLSLAQDILFIGKTVILFGYDPIKGKKHSSSSKTVLLKQNFGESALRRYTIWEEKETEFHEKLFKLVKPNAFERNTLHTVIKEIKECVTKHLWTVAVEEAELLNELRLMKDFYLLGRGELFLELLRLSSHVLENPTTRTSSRDMNQAFELAARAVFLGSHADIEKFTFELPYSKPDLSTDSTGSTVADGWSTIILKYHLKWPLHLLFTPEVLARYNDMFRLLLRIKKTQHDLHALWKTYKQARSFSLCQLHNKLMFLMDNLQHYLQADVLESNYSKFMQEVEKTNDFERLRKAHAAFLADVLSQSFLTDVKDESESDSSLDSPDIGNINNPVLSALVDLLRLCDAFCRAGDEPDTYCLIAFDDRFTVVVRKLLYVLRVSRGRERGANLARLLMRLDYNRWLSADAKLAGSLTDVHTAG